MGKKKEEAVEEVPRYPWHAHTREECYKELGVESNVLSVGLTTDDAKTRLAKYGPNKLTEKEKVTLLQRIWNQVANVLVGILVFVAIVSLARAVTSTTSENIVSNSIQVGLIVFVMYANLVNWLRKALNEG